MGLKERVKRLEQKLQVGDQEKRVIVFHVVDVGRTDLPDFPYENNEDCKSYQRQIRKKQETQGNSQVWIVELSCQGCQEDCPFRGKMVGPGKNDEM